MSSSTPTFAVKAEQLPPSRTLTDDGAWVPSPLAYCVPSSVSGPPSRAPSSPLLLSRSTGPQPLLESIHSRSLTQGCPVGAGGSGLSAMIAAKKPRPSPGCLIAFTVFARIQCDSGVEDPVIRCRVGQTG